VLGFSTIGKLTPHVKYLTADRADQEDRFVGTSKAIVALETASMTLRSSR
jgi:hypothetical protein